MLAPPHSVGEAKTADRPFLVSPTAEVGDAAGRSPVAEGAAWELGTKTNEARPRIQAHSPLRVRAVARTRLPHSVGEAKTAHKQALLRLPHRQGGRRGRADARPQRGQPTIRTLEPRTRTRYDSPMAYRKTRTLRFARGMRSEPTLAEDRLWYHLRRGQMGSHFRRQEPIGPFIADFACLKARLIVEVDGDSHTDPARDRRRDRWFHDHGWFVLRFWDTYVLEQTDDALDLVDLALHDRDAVPDPLDLES